MDRLRGGGGQGTDTVRSTLTRTLAANFERLELEGNSAINGTGNSLGNFMLGNASANVLNGGAGAERSRRCALRALVPGLLRGLRAIAGSESGLPRSGG